MVRFRLRRTAGWLVGIAILPGFALTAQAPRPVENAAGLRLLVAGENADPTLRILLPGQTEADSAIQIIFPEHVTVRKHGENEAAHLYLWQPGREGHAPAWTRTDDGLQYQMELGYGLRMMARATLQPDGVLFHYEFGNDSAVDYDMVYAPTDSRLTGMFHDVRLERTYVHHGGGFELLASETPKRLTMPLNEWLPARYMDSYTWPVPAKLVERRSDGIMYYNKSRVVDEPMVATVSADGKWVVASFTRTVGNVWSNPELTCQHVDPSPGLPANGTAVVEVKMLILRGSLDDALQHVVRQRNALK